MSIKFSYEILIYAKEYKNKLNSIYINQFIYKKSFKR